MAALSDIEGHTYSQNGEDGIVDYLVTNLVAPYPMRFVEIGCGSGGKNNTTNLVKQGWSGVVFDRSEAKIARYRSRGFDRVTTYAETVVPESAASIVKRCGSDPCVFSLDIDSHDYHVASSLLIEGFRPAIAVLEYNAAFGDRALTVPYPVPKTGTGKFNKYHYFGCGVSAWRALWGRHGYRFVTVDSAGVNAFFVRDGVVCEDAMKGIQWVGWADCRSFVSRFGPASERWGRIKSFSFEKVGP